MKEIKKHKAENSTINILLWGKEGVGKTYLSASMPKPCLYLTFDPNALNGVNDLLMNGTLTEDDIPYIAYDEGDYKEIASAYKDPKNPFGLNQIYEQCPFKTLVLDSLSSFFKLALQYGVDVASGFNQKERATIERPTLAGYGVRSTATREMAFNTFYWCRKHGVNCVFIAHEGEMIKDEGTGILYHGISLSGDIANEISRWCDESWWLGIDAQQNRVLIVQPSPTARPLKSRMFDGSVKTVQANSLNLDSLLDAWRAKGKLDNQALSDMKG